MMASNRFFSILGNSNIKRHLTPMNCRNRPLMSGAQNIPCGCLDLLSAALKSVRESSNVCILSCVTNFITASTGSTTASCNYLQGVKWALKISRRSVQQFKLQHFFEVTHGRTDTQTHGRTDKNESRQYHCKFFFGIYVRGKEGNPTKLLPLHLVKDNSPITICN